MSKAIPIRQSSRTWQRNPRPTDLAIKPVRRKKDIFLFLELPSEIRNLIYSHALTRETPIRPRPRLARVEKWSKPLRCTIKYRDDRGNFIWQPEGPTICRLNKQTSKEANEILYSTNLFTFSDPAGLLCFETQIGLVNIRLIQRIEICQPCEYNKVAETACMFLKDFSKMGCHPLTHCPTYGMSGLRNITELTIRLRSDREDRDYFKRLGVAIHDILTRERDVEQEPQLRIMGCEDSELVKFQRRWKIQAEKVNYTLPRADIYWYGIHPKEFREKFRTMHRCTTVTKGVCKHAAKV